MSCHVMICLVVENISYWKRHWRINKKRRCAWLCGGFQMTTAQFFCLLCFICMLITLIVMLIAIYAIAPALVKQIVAKSKVKFDAVGYIITLISSSCHHITSHHITHHIHIVTLIIPL